MGADHIKVTQEGGIQNENLLHRVPSMTVGSSGRLPAKKVTTGAVTAGIIQTKGHGEDERQQVHMR